MFAYGKFTACRMEPDELGQRSAMPDAEGAPLISYGGHRRFDEHGTLITDLQRGTGFVWPLANGEYGMRDYMRQHLYGLRILVCPMYLPFVRWLHEQGTWANGDGNLEEIPSYLELKGIDVDF